MYSKSNHLVNLELDFLFRGQAFVPPTTYYVGLLTSTNGDIARSTAYAVGNTVSVLTSDTTYHLYSCTTAGTTAAAAPTYPGVVGEAITDGTAVFTEQTAALKAGTFTEVSGGSYARQSIAASLTNFSGTQGAGTTVASSGTSGVISTNVAVTFPQSTATWGNIWGGVLMDALTGGNLYEVFDLGTPTIIGTNTTVTFASGQLTISEQ